MKHCYKTNCPCKACSDAEDLHYRIQENTMATTDPSLQYEKHCEMREKLEASIIDGASKMPLNHWEVGEVYDSHGACKEVFCEAVYNGYVVTACGFTVHGELDSVFEIQIEGLA